VLRESGQVIEIGRGLYRLADAAEAEHPDLAEVAARVQTAAVCLIRALAFHGITTQMPSSIHLAVRRGNYHRIKLSAPVTVYRFDPTTFSKGLETHRTAGMPVKISSVARTIADCLKFRNKIGLDAAPEALRLARHRKRLQNRELLRYAKVLRVERVIPPYLEAVE
jgi:predicted transcriptional regulator of viral defense system